MRKTVIFFIISCLISAIAGSMSYSWFKHKPVNNKIVEVNVDEKRIECMARTLMIVYGISKWEAHYYSILFYDFSKNYKIPWEIYPAIIRIESNFKPTLVSNKQAKGIMQVISSTAAEESKLIGIDYTENQTLWNEICNMAIGCNYLSRMIKEKGLDGGVKCYLGGPSVTALKTVDNSKAQYVFEYKTSVWKEYKELTYTFRGIVAEAGQKYEIMHPYITTDSIKIGIELFDNK